MTKQLLLMAMVSLVGCAASPAEDGVVGTGGKADDGTCSQASYRTWLVDEFLPAARALPRTSEGVEQARAAAASTPCTEAHDDAYALWLAVYQQELAVVTTPFDAAVATCATACTQADYDAILAAGPSEDTARWLDILVAAKPRGGLRGQAAWNALYAPFASRAALPVLSQIEIFEHAFTFDAAEAAVNAALVAAAPSSAAPKSNAVWLGVTGTTVPGVYLPLFERAASPSSDGGATLTAEETSFLAEVAATQPTSRADLDYVTWFGAYAPRLTRALPELDETELAQLDELEGVRPENAGGPSAYGAFLQAFADRLQAIAGDATPTPTNSELAALDRLVAVKPCGTSDELAAAYDRVATAYAAVPELATQIAAIAPAACE
jgi:hypothetical protein